MVKNLKSIIRQPSDHRQLNKIQEQVVQSNINSGKLLGEINLIHKKDKILADIRRSEFKVFSQWGDDGIINFLINYLEIGSKTFVEFGVENYTECNTRFLLMNDNWSGLIIDGSEEHMSSVRKESIYWRFDLKAVTSFVTAENINDLLERNGYAGQLGLLHIDIDGNDYWVWKAIDVANPVLVIVEYQSIFGHDRPWTTPYDPGFVRGQKHFSNLYYGTSLLSLCDLAATKGYSFIGCNSNGNNAYFVRNDQLKDLVVKSPKEGYVLSKFAESRNETGNLTFLREEKRLEFLKGLPVYNTRTNQIETI